MKITSFSAHCPFEIGDMVLSVGQTPGKTEAGIDARPITDIACVHRVKSGAVDFFCELGASGHFTALQEPSDPAADVMAVLAEQEEVNEIVRIIREYPVNAKDLAVLAGFCAETGFHHYSLKAFLYQALHARQKGRF